MSAGGATDGARDETPGGAPGGAPGGLKSESEIRKEIPKSATLNGRDILELAQQTTPIPVLAATVLALFQLGSAYSIEFDPNLLYFYWASSLDPTKLATFLIALQTMLLALLLPFLGLLRGRFETWQFVVVSTLITIMVVGVAAACFYSQKLTAFRKWEQAGASCEQSTTDRTEPAATIMRPNTATRTEFATSSPAQKRQEFEGSQFLGSLFSPKCYTIYIGPDPVQVVEYDRIGSIGLFVDTRDRAKLYIPVKDIGYRTSRNENIKTIEQQIAENLRGVEKKLSETGVLLSTTAKALGVEPEQLQCLEGKGLSRSSETVLLYRFGASETGRLPGQMESPKKEDEDRFVEFFKRRKKASVIVYGFADPNGTPDANLIISRARAETVARHLREKLGVGAPVIASGRGETWRYVADLGPLPKELGVAHLQRIAIAVVCDTVA